jgi:anthranilate/para-aminobenzoate synthase component I
MLAADRVVTIDHATGESWLWFVDDVDGRDWAVGMRRRLAGLEATASSRDDTDGADGADVPTAGAPHWRHDDAEYLRMIGACQESIRAGDAYQLCLTNTATVQTSADPFTVYRRLRRSSNAAHGAYVRADDVAVLSASPELFLSIADGVAITRPVKGTRRRAASAAEDARLREELAVNEKENAENLMIVDLMRNDLGRVARIGGVSVTELLAVETHAHVHQLVSTVRAELAEETDVLDVLAASFPAGSMTGAPKLSAMTLLHELERGPRGVYSGCLGRLGLDGRAELAMVIRTIVMSPGLATVGSGGGITALSLPDEELAEVKLKARALFEALGVPVATADGNLSDTSE